MGEKKYNLVKALSWYTIGSVLIKSINFISLRLFTELINANDFGVYGVFQSYLTIFEMVILLGTAHSIKMMKYDKEVDYDTYVSSVIYIPIIGTILLLFLTGCIDFFTGQIADLPTSMWYILFVTAGISSVVSIIGSRFILEGNYRLFIFSSLINTVTNIGVSVGLCYTIYNNSNAYWARIYGGLTSGIINCIFLLLFFKPRKPQIEYIKKGIVLGLPLLVHSVATQVLVQTDKILISQMCSYSQVGIYTAAVNLVVIPMTLLSSVEHSWSPWYYESLSKKDYKGIKGINTKILSLFSVGLVLFILGSPEVVHIMTNKEYWDSVYVLIPLTVSVFAELVYIIPLNLELYYKKNNAIWLYTTSAVVINIIFDLIFIRSFGYMASAWVTCASRFILFILHFFRAKRIDKHTLMNMKVIVVLIILILASSFLTMYVYQNWIVRWSVILIVLLVTGAYLLRNRKVIMR